MKQPTSAQIAKLKENLQGKQRPILGVVRLDVGRHASEVVVRFPASNQYDVIYRVVPGLTLEMAKSGRMTPMVSEEFKKAIMWLESQGASGITGNSGFMIAFQHLARQVADCPVFMSSMIQFPMVSVAIDKADKVLILTGNVETLKPQKQLLSIFCGLNIDDGQFLIAGCEDVPGFDAAALGDAVDVQCMTSGILALAKNVLSENPMVRAIVLESSELPPYADALRASCKLPVFDAITCADFFIDARKDNPRFGLNNWQSNWDEHVAKA